MNIAQLLLNIDNDYSGHKQTVIKGLSLEDGIQICKELEEYTDNTESFVLELWTDGNWSIYQKDSDGVGTAWGDDRLILSTSG